MDGGIGWVKEMVLREERNDAILLCMNANAICKRKALFDTWSQWRNVNIACEEASQFESNTVVQFLELVGVFPSYFNR